MAAPINVGLPSNAALRALGLLPLLFATIGQPSLTLELCLK